MEQKDKKEKKKITIKEIGIQKIVIMFIAGILIIALSVPDIFGSKNKKKSEINDISSNPSETTGSTDKDNISREYVNKLEQELKSKLRLVEGIGDVDVMITLKSSKELIPLKDNPYSQDSTNEEDANGGSRVSSNIKKEEETVLITNDDGEKVPYVIKEIEPEIGGVIVIARGGDDKKIVGEIIDAVEVLFSIPTHKIKVMKMNSR